jgi:ribosomal protein L37E
MSEKPKLAQIGANERDAPSSINIDVSGTTGPGYLGQQMANVDGHPCDRPGVRSRLPENHADDPRISRMDTGEELPVLLSSNMRADPIEGTQGTYTEIVEGECSRCGYDRLKVTRHTLAGESKGVCNACGYDQHRESMPTTDEERADKERESGQKLGELLSEDVYDMEPDTGMGAYVSLVSSNSIKRMRKDDVAELFTMVFDDPEEQFDVMVDELGPIDEMVLSALGKANFEKNLEEAGNAES